jgi:hypothetical protein
MADEHLEPAKPANAMSFDSDDDIARKREQTSAEGSEARLLHSATELVDRAWDAPLSTFIDLGEVANRGVTAIVTLTSHPKWFEVVRERLAQARHEIRQSPESGASVLPMTVVGPLHELLGRSIQVPRPLVQALMDHPASRELMLQVLVDTLSDFAKRLRELAPEPPKVPGMGFASRLVGAATSVASGVASFVAPELERQLDKHVRTFASEALHKATMGLVSRLCDPSFAKKASQWRQDGLVRIMDEPLAQLFGPFDSISDEEVATFVHDSVVGLLEWPAAREWLQREVESTLRAHSPVTVGEGAAMFGIEKAWAIESAERTLRWVLQCPDLATTLAELFAQSARTDDENKL